MSFTRFHDDPCRISKQLEESTGIGKYMLNVPGNGMSPYFMEDPYFRMQKWYCSLPNGGKLLEAMRQKCIPQTANSAPMTKSKI